MKKILFALAMVGIITVSCGKDNGDKNGDNGDDIIPEVVRVIEDFEGGSGMTWNPADGYQFEVVTNPFKTGINTSNKVGKMTTGTNKWGFCWTSGFGGGTYEAEDIEYLDFTKDGYILKLDVYSPKKNSPVFLKLESGGKGDPASCEITTVKTTKENEWETLEFDFETYALADGVYGNIVLLFDAGVEPAVGGLVYYFDNLRICKE